LGWRIATEADRIAIYNFVGGIAIAGGKLKETGFDNWDSPNTDAVDSVGFKGIPGGHRTVGDFWSLRRVLEIWTSTEYGPDPTMAYWYGMYHNMAAATNGTELKNVGFSVICVRDV
jgi:uncharacterized protein (TIGR02145 family)